MKINANQIMKYYLKQVNRNYKNADKLDYTNLFYKFLAYNLPFFSRILKLDKKEIVKLYEFFEYEIEQLKKIKKNK